MSDLVEISTDGIHSCEFEYWPNQKKMREIYIRFDGRRIAYRGQPDTPQARTWVAIDKRYRVRDENDGDGLVIEFARGHWS